MPTYEYLCTSPNCGNEFELVQSFTDPTASECPVCDGPVRKVFSAVGVVFKGSGFYRTDSRKDSPAEARNGSRDNESSGDKESSDKESRDKAKSGDSTADAPTKPSTTFSSPAEKASSTGSSDSSSNTSSAKDSKPKSSPSTFSTPDPSRSSARASA